MIYNINMEFIEAFNPLYAIPIVAVVFCAFIVYAFGFKTPVQPPSFDEIKEDKKYNKKRKTKESQKQTKVIVNGNLNGVKSKGKVSDSVGKKDPPEKHISDKLSNNEKSPAEKKVAKKAKSQNEKKLSQEKKKETVLQEDFNDDGWVQLVSKKVKKGRKKDDSTASEIQVDGSQSTKPMKANKSDTNFQANQLPKQIVELLIEESTDVKKEVPEIKPMNEVTKVAVTHSNSEKAVVQNVTLEVKPDANAKESPVEAAVTISKVLDETSKSKKKKKKLPVTENEKANNITPATTVEVTQITPPQEDLKFIAPSAPETALPVPDKTEVKSVPEVKSNVAFDELAGLYPETKEKKKKKVRRDH